VREGSHATVQRTMEATYVTDLNEEEQRALDTLSQKYTLIEAFEQKSRESSSFLTKQQDVLKQLDLDERQAQKNVAALEAAFARFDEEKRTVSSAVAPAPLRMLARFVRRLLPRGCSHCRLFCVCTPRRNTVGSQHRYE